MKTVAFIKAGISVQGTARILLQAQVSWTTSTIRIVFQIGEIGLIKFQSFNISK